MEYFDYIKAELLILIPVLYYIGSCMKKSSMKDELIPVSLGVISIVLSALWIVSNSDFNSIKDFAAALFMAVTQGVLIAGATVYTNQIIKQKGRGRKNDDSNNG